MKKTLDCLNNVIGGATFCRFFTVVDGQGVGTEEIVRKGKQQQFGNLYISC